MLYGLLEDEFARAEVATSFCAERFFANVRHAVIKDTGGWDKFQTVDLGVVSIEKTGDTKVVVKARMKPGYAVMNLRSIKLVPANAR